MLLLEIISLSAKHNTNTLITQLSALPQQSHPKRYSTTASCLLARFIILSRFRQDTDIKKCVLIIALMRTIWS